MNSILRDLRIIKKLAVSVGVSQTHKKRPQNAKSEAIIPTQINEQINL